MAKKTPSRLGRLARLGGLTRRVTSSYVKEQVRRVVTNTELGRQARDKLHLDNARDVVEAMSQLKGAAMKVGQQVAMFADSLDLPDEVSDLLGTLHADAEPAPFPQIREDIEAELGASLDTLFAHVDPEPLGTASLAQAHAATLHDGTDAVVKVLHRGVDESVATDLLALKGILLSTRAVRRSKAEIDDIFAEIRERMEEELDYLLEAANLYRYHELYGDDPRVVVPDVHPELSGERVLTMGRIPGVHIDRFLATATDEARQRAGRTLAEFYYEQVFVHRTLHADPHPGNYLFQEDGTVGVLDFGSVKRFDEFWIGTYAQVALAMLDDDRDTALEAAIQLGAWDGQGEAAGEALWQFIRGMGMGFRSGPIVLGQTDHDLIAEMEDPIRGLIPHGNVRAPRDVIMLHRSLGGLYALGTKLGAELDFGSLLRGQAAYARDRALGRSAEPPAPGTLG